MTSSADVAASWLPVGVVSPTELARARVEALNLVQWPVRIANSYVEREPAAERVMLSYRPERQAFVTRPFCGDLAVEMRLPSLELQFLEQGLPAPHVFDPEERSPAEAEAWVLVELLHRKIDRDRFSKALPYEIAGLSTGDANDYAPVSCRRGLEELAHWFSNATAVIAALARGANESTVVCWPETLELRYRAGDTEAFFFPGRGDTQGPSFAAGRIGGAKAILTVAELSRADDPFATARAFMSAALR